MGKLTAVAVKNARKPGRYYDGQGLMLLVKTSGARSWLVRIQAKGRRRDFGLGSVSMVSLSEARERALETRKLVEAGKDPVNIRQRSQAIAAALPTFREAATQAHRDHEGSWRNQKHRAQWLSSLESYAFPHIGDMLISEVEAPSIITLLRPIWLTRPETARRVRQRVRTVLDWAHAKGFRNTEAPTSSISKGLPRQPKSGRHFAALPYADAPGLMLKLSEADSFGRLALRFLILTAARSGEVRGATWAEVDFERGVWTVPALRMKAGREHAVPLSNEALAVLQKANEARKGSPEEPIFPGLAGRSMSDMTLTKVLRTARVDDVTVHGFRSTFRDWAAEMTNFDGSVVEAALAHSNPNRVEAAYRRTDFLEKRQPLMAAWSSFLSGDPTG